MANNLYKVKAELPIKAIWNFVSIMDNWAPLVPGYIEHTIINESESTWTFKTDLGLIKKKIQLKVDITEWIEPEKVTFKLTGINEKISGNGYFEAKASDQEGTFITGYLEIIPEGAMAKMIQSKLKKNLSEMTKEMTDAIIEKIKEQEKVIK
ncbi:carbon monoxide dehydrogenase [Bacillus sp. 7586-K]|nr:carbon monoxide dehydrogenase [Bacillus sp. 7586-K]